LKYKVCTLVGTRPELIKLSRVIPELDRYFNHTLIHSGQNYDYTLNKIFFQDLKIRKPDYFLNVKDNVLSKLIANIIYKTDIIFEKIKPDALLVYGDTNTSLGILSAKRKKIPIFHMEAGNRCFDQRVPEEINRKIADHLSDVNMVISNQAKENLIREGINPEFIFKLGSNMFEVINFYKNKINDSKILTNLSLQKDKFILVSIHIE
jgi:UDP-N-acetylglucosamine 2-epimerase (non-hydrolysing)